MDCWRYDPRLPGPDDAGQRDSDGGGGGRRRRLGGPIRSAQNDADYDEYCTLYREYVRARAPFWNKRDSIPWPEPSRHVPAWQAFLDRRVVDAGGGPEARARVEAKWADRTAEVKEEHARAWKELGDAIDKLADCNYVHSFGGPTYTRTVWLYDYASTGGGGGGGGLDEVHDVTCAPNRMLPTPGGPEVAHVELQTAYFTDTGVNYVPERRQVTGPDGAGVTVGVEPPAKRGRGQAANLCITISKHPATAARYASLLWAAVNGDRN